MDSSHSTRASVYSCPQIHTFTAPLHQTGWNAIDAVRLTGTADVSAGLVLAVPGAEHPNRVTYEPWAGVHGNETFSYTASDCYDWSLEPAEVIVQVEAPRSDFSTSYQYDTQSRVQGQAFPLSIDLSDILRAMDGIANLRSDQSDHARVRVEVRAVANLSLSSDAEKVFNLSTGDTTTGDVLGGATVLDFPGRAELWLTIPDVSSTMTFRAQTIICPPFHTWSLDTPGLSGSCASCDQILNADSLSGPTDIASW